MGSVTSPITDNAGLIGTLAVEESQAELKGVTDAVAAYRVSPHRQCDAHRLGRRAFCIGNFDFHPVVGRLDMRRQLPAQHVVVEIGMQVGQDRALGF